MPDRPRLDHRLGTVSRPLLQAVFPPTLRYSNPPETLQSIATHSRKYSSCRHSLSLFNPSNFPNLPKRHSPQSATDSRDLPKAIPATSKFHSRFSFLPETTKLSNLNFSQTSESERLPLLKPQPPLLSPPCRFIKRSGPSNAPSISGRLRYRLRKAIPPTSDFLSRFPSLSQPAKRL